MYITVASKSCQASTSITARTVVHTVLMATSQSNRNGQNLTLTESKLLNWLW